MDEFTKQFIEKWWKSEDIQDVIEWLKTTDKGIGKDDKKLATYANNQASKLRKLDIPMKYLSGRPRGVPAVEIDKKEALSFLASIGVDKAAQAAARKEQERKLKEFEERQAKAKAAGKSLGRKAKT